MILSNLTVPLVGLVSTAAVGHLNYAYELGAVALGTSFYAILAALSGSLRMGITGFTAQASGKQDANSLRLICAQSFLMAIIASIFLMFLALPLTNYALALMQPSVELAENTRAFFTIRLFGLPAIMLQQALIGWFLGVQNPRTPLIIMVLTNLSNIVLVISLVTILGFGVEGAAIASICAEWLGAFLGTIAILLRLRKVKGKLNLSLLKQWQSWHAILVANRDIFIRTIAVQFVFLSVNLRSANLGDTIVAANAILLNGLLVCSYALDGLAHAVEALCGHALGARKKYDLQRYLIVAGGWSFVISLLFALGFALFGDLFIILQTNIASVISTANQYLIYLVLLPIIAVWSFIFDGLFIAATKARAMRNTMLLSLLSTLPVAIMLTKYGNHGVWIPLLLFMLLRGLFMLKTVKQIYTYKF